MSLMYEQLPGDIKHLTVLTALREHWGTYGHLTGVTGQTASKGQWGHMDISVHELGSAKAAGAVGQWEH